MNSQPAFTLTQTAFFIASALFSPFAAHAAETLSAAPAAGKTETVVVTAQALKVDSRLQETPKSVSVVSEEELNIHAPQKLDEALRYTSGVVAQPYGADNDTDWFKVRGFDAATYLDNSRLFRDGYYTWQLEPWGFEHLEVVKGASSVLFGESTPGGAVNVVLKKPTFKPQGQVFIEGGNKDQRAVGVDVADNVTADGAARYRFVGLFKKGDGELNGSENQRVYLAPSLLLTLSDATTLTLLGTYLHDDGTPTNPFFPVSGTLRPAAGGKISPSTNLGEPDYDTYKRTQFSLGYLLEHNFADDWQFAQRFNYGYNNLTLRSVYAFPNADPTVTELPRGVVFRDGISQSVTLDNHLKGEWQQGRLAHTVLSGVELQYHRTKGDEQDNYAFSPINPWKPVYNHYTPLNPADNINRTIDKQQASLYSSYQLKLDEKWIGTAGLRYDWVKTENKSRDLQQQRQRHDGEWTTSAGLMYLADNGLSPYAAWSQSFEVLSTIDPATGELYKPLKGDQLELGMKYTPASGDGYLNVALFDITQKNALVTNPNTFIATQTGKVTSHGVEAEMLTPLGSDLTLKGNYTYTLAKTDESGGRGRQQAGLIPKHMASLWLDYQVPYAPLQGLTIGTGVRYLGKSKDNPASSNLTVPDATLWDLAATYALTKQWQVQLNVNNVLDKTYVSACDYYCYYGQSRSVLLKTSYRW